MELDKLQEMARLAIEKMDKGDFGGSLEDAYRIRSLGQHYLVSYVASGLLIDIGSALRSEKTIREGIDLLSNDLERIACHEEYASSAYYNLANGYSALFGLQVAKDPYCACFKETCLDLAKACYRRALTYEIEDRMLNAHILVNMGNCFDHLGRVVDALECYDKSLELNPNHGMALGNKGQALLYYAALSGEHQATFLLEAHSLLSQALKLGVPTEAIGSFEECLKSIEEKYPKSQFPKSQPGYPGYSIRARSKFERLLVEFCLKNKLYLNTCNFCQKCDAAIGDTAVIKKMIVTPHSDFYLASSVYLNHIKQDYATARFLLFLSRYEGLNLDFVDKRVRIIDTLDNSVHNIHIHLTKASFKMFYDILDKIALFINHYLRLGIPVRKVDFRRVWYMNDKSLRVEIENTKNLSLNALFDIYRDFEGPYKILKDIRDALTHRFVNIKRFHGQEDSANMTERTLVGHTLELAEIVRTAIIYLLQFVNVEEGKKERRVRGVAMHLVAFDVPDSLKTGRQRLRKTRRTAKRAKRA